MFNQLIFQVEVVVSDAGLYRKVNPPITVKSVLDFKRTKPKQVKSTANEFALDDLFSVVTAWCIRTQVLLTPSISCI